MDLWVAVHCVEMLIDISKPMGVGEEFNQVLSLSPHVQNNKYLLSYPSAYGTALCGVSALQESQSSSGGTVQGERSMG